LRAWRKDRLPCSAAVGDRRDLGAAEDLEDRRAILDGGLQGESRHGQNEEGILGRGSVGVVRVDWHGGDVGVPAGRGTAAA
jgi:hypothetical protein